MGPRDPAHRTKGWAQRLWGVASRSPWALVLAAALLRVGLVNRHGLWADEFFSLAMATCHSLEHPADRADPGQGDFVEHPVGVPPAAYSLYLKHDTPPAGPGRVLRAVYLSETSPPLYYLLLNPWTRLLGTGDAALRLFSVAWALACLPVLWSLARRVGGRAAQWPACLLFAFSPLGLFYSTEGRMYALLWFWAVSLMALTLRLHRRGARPGSFALWVAVGAAGFLTHYFFAFVWAAAVAWLALAPGRLSRKALLGGAALVGVIIFPWYRHVPASMAQWRVTAGWLNIPPEDFHFWSDSFGLFWSYFAVYGVWGGGRPLFESANRLVYLALAVAVAWRLRGSLFRGRRGLLWLWVGGACLGVVAFDLWQGTYATAVSRYALAGMPGAFLLVGLGLGRLGRLPRLAFLALILAGCLVGDRSAYRSASRSYEPTRWLGRVLAERAGAGDLVIVHSIPSGVAGVARYLEAYGADPGEIRMASWVGQLGRRHAPEDLRRLAAGCRRVILVKVHDVGEPAPEETWLEEHATRTELIGREGATVAFYHPQGSVTFFPTRQQAEE